MMFLGKFVASKRTAAAVVLAGSLLTLASVAGADGPRPRTSSLGWVRLVGAEGCVGPRALAQSVEGTLGRIVFVSAAQAEVAIEGRIERGANGQGWRAVLTMSDAQGAVVGTRELVSEEPSCAALNESLTLSLAVMIDPDAVLRPVASPPRPLVPVRVATPPRKEAPCAPTEKPSVPWSWGAQAAGAVGVGYVPGGTAIGLTMGGFVRPPRWWAFEWAGTFWPRRPTTTSEGQGADLTLAYGSLAVCPLRAGGASPRAVQGRGCVGAQVGSLAAEGKGLDVAQQRTRLVGNAALHLRAFWPILPPFGLQGSLGVGAPVLRESFVYSDVNGTRRDLFQLPPVTAWAELGVGVQFL